MHKPPKPRHTKTPIEFTNHEYNSKDGMMTSIWGPPLWHFLHTMSFNYPINPSFEDQHNYRQFITNLRYILPCKYCRDNFDL